MTLFWFVTALLIVVALILVTPAFLGRGRPRALGRDALNRAVYRDRLMELDAAHADASLDEGAYREARGELESAMLVDVSAGPDGPAGKTDRRSSPVAAIVAAVGIPLLAFGLYLQLGNVKALANASSVTPVARTAHSRSAQPSLERMVAKLETRLRKNPDDARGWLMLARSYAFLKRSAAARDAFAHAYRLAPEDTTMLVGYAETLTRIARGRISDEALKRLDEALRINPRMPPALWLSGMGAYQRGNSALALERWELVRAIGGLGAEQTRVLARFIALAGGRPSPAAGAASAAGGRQVAGTTPSASSTAAGGGRIEVSIGQIVP